MSYLQVAKFQILPFFLQFCDVKLIGLVGLLNRCRRLAVACKTLFNNENEDALGCTTAALGLLRHRYTSASNLV